MCFKLFVHIDEIAINLIELSIDGDLQILEDVIHLD